MTISCIFDFFFSISNHYPLKIYIKKNYHRCVWKNSAPTILFHILPESNEDLDFFQFCFSFSSQSNSGLALSGESSPVSSPATSHSSPVSTPKQATLGPLLTQSRGHAVVPSTPPVVTIAPTKTSNGLWRAEGRQVRMKRGLKCIFVVVVFLLNSLASQINCPH